MMTQLDPIEVSILNTHGIGNRSLNDTDDNIQYVRSGELVTNTDGDKNTYYIESGGQVNQSEGSGHLVYVKRGGILNISGDGGSITIYREPGAIVNNTLSGDGTNYYRECQSITFNLPVLERCEIEIPADAIRGTGEVTRSSRILYVEDGEVVTSSSNVSNTFYIESGGVVTQDGGVNHVIYIKRNGTINILGNSSMTINYEEGAFINRNDMGNIEERRCSEVILNPAVLEPCEIEIPDDAVTGSAMLNSASNIRHVLDGDIVTNNGASNTYYIESGGTVTHNGGAGQTIYVKNNGTINFSGSSTSTIINYEEGAIINRTELGSVLVNKCSEVIFN